MADEFGKPVTLTEAQSYVDYYKALKVTLRTEILTRVPFDAEPEEQTCATFHQSEVNAFIFDATLIKPFLDGPDPVQYFGVFLGANGAHVTAILTGMNPGAEPNTLVAALPKAPPVEHPKLVTYLGNNLNVQM
jgi:hypothetical protein